MSASEAWAKAFGSSGTVVVNPEKKAAFEASKPTSEQAISNLKSQLQASSSNVGTSSSGATVSPATGGGVSIQSPTQPSIITSGAYAGMTPAERQQAVAKEIAQRGVERYGIDYVTDYQAQQVLKAVESGKLDVNKPQDMQRIADMLNRAGISEPAFITAVQNVSAGQFVPTPAQFEGRVSMPTVENIAEVPAQEVPFVDPIPDVPIFQPVQAIQETGNVVYDAFGSLQDWIFGPVSGEQGQTVPTGGRTVSIGGAWIAGIAVIIIAIIAAILLFGKKIKAAVKR